MPKAARTAAVAVAPAAFIGSVLRAARLMVLAFTVSSMRGPAPQRA